MYELYISYSIPNDMIHTSGIRTYRDEERVVMRHHSKEYLEKMVRDVFETKSDILKIRYQPIQ